MRAVAEPTWRMSAGTDAPGWLAMPALGGTEDPRAWVRSRTDGLRTAFGERWSSELERVVPTLLAAGLDRREQGDLLSWQVWPLALPVLATVHARIVDSAAVPDWLASGADVQPYDSAGLGPGVQVSATAALDEPGTTAAFTLFAFDDGAATVVVAVDPTLAEVLTFSMGGLRTLVDGMRVEAADGTAFRGRPPARFITETEGWPLEGADA